MCALRSAYVDQLRAGMRARFLGDPLLSLALLR